MSAGVGVLPAAPAADVLGPVLLGTLAAAMVAGRLDVAAGVVVLAAALAWTAGAERPGAAWWRALAWGTGLALALNLYLVPGRALALPEIAGRSGTAEGFSAGVLVGLRVCGALVALHGLRAAWPGDRAADRFAAWFLPLERIGVPVRGVRETLRLALRMMPAVASEHRRIRRLQAMRAGAPPRGMRERLARERAALIPTVIAAVEAAERLALALEARHYRLRPVRIAGRIPPLATAAGIAIPLVSLFTRG